MPQQRMDNGYHVRMAAVEQVTRGNRRSMLDTVAEERQCTAVDKQQQSAVNNERQLKTRWRRQNNNHLHSDFK